MLKGRSSIIFTIVLIALVAILALLLRQRGLPGSPASQQAQIPIELRNIIPSSWQLLDKQPQPCNLDDDLADEWLVLYRYDTTEVPNAYAARESKVPHSPIGGIVYDAQVNRVPQAPNNIASYRPALLMPYKLLPDFYTDKGQGYLGESDVKFHPYASSQPGGRTTTTQCRAEELYFLGYSYLPLPTRLSIFRWRSPQLGYQGIHFVGDAHVDAENVTAGSKPVTKVTTYNRLANHRSLLCEVKRFERQGELVELNFREKTAEFTIDFCFGTPNDPVYPEAALIALLRGANPQADGSPTGNSFLVKNARLDLRLEVLRTAERQPLRIVSVINQGSVSPTAGQGMECSADMLQSPGKAKWWCNDEAVVWAAIIFSGESEPRWVVARLISIANDQVTAGVHWRVRSLTLE